jgi:hypothetical protein
VAIWTKFRPGTQSKAHWVSPEELLSTTWRYVTQETLLPLKRIGKVLGFGIVGALCFGGGAVIALVGVLRLLQAETGTTFRGVWGFAPYLLTGVAGLVLLAGTAGAYGAASRARRSRSKAAR